MVQWGHCAMEEMWWLWHCVSIPVSKHWFLCPTYDKFLWTPWKNHRFNFTTKFNICPSCYLRCCKNYTWCHREETNVTHWDRNNMAAISQTAFSKRFLLKESLWVLIQIWLKFIPRGSVCNLSSSCRLFGDMPYLNQCWSSSQPHISITTPRWVKSITIANHCYRK